MKGRGLWAVAACLFALAVLVSGCGSSDSSSAEETNAAAIESTGSDNASAGPLTKKEFVQQAEQICYTGLRKKDANVRAALKTLPQDNPEPVTKKAAGKLVVLAVLPVYSEIIEQLDELTPPKADETAAGLIVQKYEAAMQATEADPTVALDSSNPFQAGDRAAEAYGVTKCVL